MMDVICKCLKVFYDATKKFLGTKYPTSNTFFYDVCVIHVKLLAWKDSLYDYVCAMGEKMMIKFKKYWVECSLVLVVALVFNPRYKIELVKFYCKTIHSGETKKMIDKVCMVVYDLYFEYVTTSTFFKSSMAFVDVSHDASSPIIEEDEEYLEFDTWYEASHYSSTCAQKSELDLYLEKSLVPWKKNLNILQWW